MSILLNNNGYDNKTWQLALSELLPSHELQLFSALDDSAGAREKIEYAVVWDHPRGDLARYPNLKGILLLGAGTEAIEQELNLPLVPIVKLIDPEVLDNMALYVLHWVTHFYLKFDVYREQQKERRWHRQEICRSADYTVTILGLGHVGTTVAERLKHAHFKVKAWDKFHKDIEGVECFHDQETIQDALRDSNILINCLPLNQETEQFIDDKTLSYLPEGASVINVSRGKVINERDLIRKLDSGYLHHAVLDAFPTEPLPCDDAMWTHPSVTVTPHMSGATYARSAARLIAANIHRIEAGEAPFPVYNRSNNSTAQNTVQTTA